MTPATEKQIGFIRSLCARIVSVDTASLPTKAKQFGRTYNPRACAEFSRSLAEEALSKLDGMTVGAASTWISTLKAQ